MIGLLVPLISEAGKVRSTAGRVNRGSSSSWSKSESYDEEDGEDDDGLFSAIIGLFELIGGEGAQENGLQKNTIRTLLPRPYAQGYSGYKIVENIVTSPESGEILSRQVTPANGDPSQGRTWAARIGTDYQYDWANVHLNTAQARVESAVGLGLSLRWTGFFEPLDGVIDMLSLLEGGVFWDMIPNPQIKLELGASLLGMFYGGMGWLGGTGGLRMDIFPKKPLVISGEISVGGINEALYLRGRGTLGVIFGPAEIYAGYDGQWFGTDDDIVYHGPVIGLRMWL